MSEEKSTVSGLGGVVAMLANAATRNVSRMFPGYFPDAKHDHYKDFGWPDKVTFDLLLATYKRNGLGAAAVKKTARTVWQTAPLIRESEEEHEKSPTEVAIRKRLTKLRFWQKLAEADRRSMVGRYSAVILRIADSKQMHDPVESVNGGIEALVEVIPVWENQLKVSLWDEDEASETYGQPMMYQFKEASVGETGKAGRQFNVHPDRVVIWSEDGTIHGQSMLEPGFNDLMTLEKIAGAGGQGFWKNAKSAPVLKMDKEARLDDMAKAMGVEKDDLVEAMNEQVEDWQKGFDKILMLQGMEAGTLDVTLPSPEHFRAGPLENFAASIEMPVKILVGMQTGERASSEDAKEWAKTCMGRRSDIVIPNIMEIIERLVSFNIINEADWHLEWTDLTEASMAEKIDRADKMADVNQKMSKTGEIVFPGEEIRATVDLEPLSDADKYRDEDDPDDEPDDLDPSQTD